MLNCEYDERNQCKGCKIEHNCLLKQEVTPTLRQVQDHIRDLLQLIDQAETDLNTIDKIQRWIDTGMYANQKNHLGEPITMVSEVANYPERSSVLDELSDLRFELKLYRRKEFELIKEIGDRL